MYMGKRRRARQILAEEGGLSLVRQIVSYITRHSERKFANRYPSYHRLYKIWKNEYIGGYEALPDPQDIIEIDPATVHYYTTEGMYYWHYELAGEVKGGEWDRNVRPISEYWKYLDMVNRFKYNVSWKETHHYRRLMEGGPLEDIEPDLTTYDKLYESIREDGFKSARELEDGKKVYYGDVCVAIGRNGQILFTRSGWHRLAIAKLLDIEAIPVRVLIRHQEWQNIRDEVCANELDPKDCQWDVDVREHPDLRKIGS